MENFVSLPKFLHHNYQSCSNVAAIVDSMTSTWTTSHPLHLSFHLVSQKTLQIGNRHLFWLQQRTMGQHTLLFCMLHLVSKWGFHFFAKAPAGNWFGKQKEVFFLLLSTKDWLMSVYQVFFNLLPKRRTGKPVPKPLGYGAFNLLTYFKERKQ